MLIDSQTPGAMFRVAVAEGTLVLSKRTGFLTSLGVAEWSLRTASGEPGVPIRTSSSE